MRPVNLIPPEDRRGDRGPLRTGALPYVLIGGLAVALAAVSMLVLTKNTVAEREAELASLEAQETALGAEAAALRPYADFASLAAARETTVDTLAQSRFDWERVMRELALVIPDDVWLIGATGTVAPGVELEGGLTVQGRDTIPGPALELVGCGASHEAVAGFLATLRDIDGVTRVGIASSERPEPLAESSTAAPASDSAGSEDDCRTRDFIAKFEVVVAFDAVPSVTVPEAGAVPAQPAPAPAEAAAPASTAAAPAATASAAGDEAAGDAAAQQTASRDSATAQTGKARKAAEAVR